MMRPPRALDLSRLSPPAQWAVVGGAAALVAASAWLLALGPLARAVRTQAGRLTDLKAMTAEAHVLTSQTAAHQASYAAALADYQRAMQRVAPDVSLARVLEALGAQAKLHRLDLSSIQPEDPDPPQRYAVDSRLTLRAVPIRVHVRGRYQQVGQFLEALAGAPYLAAVREMTLSRPAGDSRQLEADIVVSVYLAEEASS